MLDPDKNIPGKEQDKYLLSALKSPGYNAYYVNNALKRGGSLENFDLTKLLNTHLRAGDTIIIFVF